MKDFDSVNVGDILTFYSDDEWPPDCFINGHSYKVLDISGDDDRFLNKVMIAVEAESPDFYHETLAKSLMLATIVGNEFGMRNFCKKGRVVVPVDFAVNFSFAQPNLYIVR